MFFTVIRSLQFLILSAGLLCGQNVTPQSSENGISQKGATVLIAGSEYSLAESITQIRFMLKSAVSVERLNALEAARWWGTRLNGSSLVPNIIVEFETEADPQVKLTALMALNAIGDARSEGAFRQASDSPDVFLKVAGLVGLARSSPNETVPKLLECMLGSTNLFVLNAAVMTLQENVGYDIPPPPDPQASAPAKIKYQQEFMQWWRAKKSRLGMNDIHHGGISRSHVLRQRTENTSETKPIPTGLSRAQQEGGIPTQVQQHSVLKELLKPVSGGNRLNLVAFFIFGLMLLGGALWVILRRKS
jgi:hypothetical protein